MELTSRYINGKTYRYGFTTGSCAAAAAKAATAMLVSGKVCEDVSICTPKGIVLDLLVQNIEIQANYAICAITKDAGDDPDVTNGILVYAKVCFNNKGIIRITGGVGVGRVMRRGLQVEVGQAAINPVPLQMIKSEVQQVLPLGQGVDVEISIPEGVEIARKTLNERLGVVGGISVLGTSGIVTPMSEEAFKDSLALELSVIAAKGFNEVVLTPGNYGQHFISSYLPDRTENTVTTSNFIGFMLHETVQHGFKKVLLVGHIGKLIKVAGGIFHTHSSVADARNEIMAAHYMLYSENASVFKQLMSCTTTEEAAELIAEKGFFDYICSLIQNRCIEHVKGALEVEVIVFSQLGGLLGSTANAKTVLDNKQHMEGNKDV